MPNLEAELKFTRDINDFRFEAMEKLFHESMSKMEAIMEKNLAKHDAIANEMRGDIKAINARLDTLESRFSWNLAWLGVIVGLVLAIVQHFWK